MRELPLDEQVRVFRLLAPRPAGAVLSELDDPTLLELVRALDEVEVSRILDRMPSDHVVEVVEELPAAEAEKILDLMEEEKSEEVQELLEYREGTAGRLMSPRVVAVHEAVTVGVAINHIRKAATGDDAFYLYVLDDHEHLVGVVPLHRLLTADPATPMRAVRIAEVQSVSVDTDQEEVARLVERYGLLEVPVVDRQRRLLGAVRVDDVIDVLREEATEDIQRLGGVGGENRARPPNRVHQTPTLAADQSGDGHPGRLRDRSVRNVDPGPGYARRLHAHRSLHGWHRDHPDGHRGRSRHCPRRHDVQRARPRASQGGVAGAHHRGGQRPRPCSDRLPVERTDLA